MRQLKRKRVSTLAASVSFFAFLSLFPFFLFVISLASLFLDRSAALAKLEEYARLFPAAVSGNVMDILQGMLQLWLFFSIMIYFAGAQLCLSLGRPSPRSGE